MPREARPAGRRVCDRRGCPHRRVAGRIPFGRQVSARLDEYAVAYAHPPARHIPRTARHKELPPMTADALTVAPSRAELWVAYHRKAIISFGPVLLAGLNVLRDAAQTSNGLDWSTVILAIFAAAQAVGTYLPDNARAKLIASGVLAVGGGVTAAVTDGISSYSLLLVTTQFIAWASAGAVENGPRPDVALTAPQGEEDETLSPFPEGTTFYADDVAPGDRGEVDALLILGVLTLLGVVLILFGVSFE